MYQSHNWFFPDEDTHFSSMLSKSISNGGPGEYQWQVRHKSFKYVKKFGVALDIGANVGLWSRDLTLHFNQVIAFEPVESFRQCLAQNVQNHNLTVMPIALGDINSTINMIITPENTGHTHVDSNSVGAGNVEIKMLDSIQLPKIDYIKIDCEGFEYKILNGAKQTILNNLPILVVEQKAHKDCDYITDNQLEAVDLLLSWGAKRLDHFKHDFIIGWN
jgi:FkbM family methyltransferase